MAKKLNERLISRIIKHIRGDFRRFDMEVYGVKANTSTGVACYKEHEWPACNTKACFAGWAVLLTTPKKKWGSLFNSDGAMKDFVSNRAAKLLGLDPYIEAESVFTASMTGNPRRDLKGVIKQLNIIRKYRERKNA